MQRRSWTGVVLVGVLATTLTILAGCSGQAERTDTPSTTPQATTPQTTTPSQPAPAATSVDAPTAQPTGPVFSPDPIPEAAMPQPAPRMVAPTAMAPEPARAAPTEAVGAAPPENAQPVSPLRIERSMAPAAMSRDRLAPQVISQAPDTAVQPKMQAIPEGSQPKMMLAPAMGASQPAESLEVDRQAAQEPALMMGSTSAAPAETAPVPAPAPTAAPAPVTVSAVPAPADASVPAPADASSGEYTTMTVFYGTDRLPVENVGPSTAAYVIWLAATGACALAAVLLVILAVRMRQRRLLIGIFGLGAAGTAALTLLAAMSMPGANSNKTLARVYGNERGTMEMGTCQVTIPKCHEVGQVERPSILKLELQEDPTKHIVITDVTPEPEEAFFARLRDRVEGSSQKEVFVFVHGFNVTFEAAAQRTAQMAYDLKFEGAPIFYSWPSQGGLLQYTVDETNVIWTVPHLKQFLVDVARRSGAQSVHLIAHSMGNRALTAALQTLAYEVKGETPLFRQVVLTAPDIDADIFRRDIAPAIVPLADRVTLYASSNDEALVLSKQIHGYPRAGDSGEGMLVIPGIDTIDVSSVDTSLIGHSYYGSNHTVLEDLWDLLNQSKPPAQRPWLHPQQLGQMMYWVFLVEQARLQAGERQGASR